MDPLAIEVWLIVDEDGDFAVGKDRESAAEAYADEFGETEGVAKRVIRIAVKVPRPKVATVSADLLDEPDVKAEDIEAEDLDEDDDPDLDTDLDEVEPV